MAAISIQLTQDSGHQVPYRASYNNGGNTLLIWCDRAIVNTVAECADVEQKILGLAGIESGYGSVGMWLRLDGSDHQVRTAAVAVIAALGQHDYPITWSTPMPYAKYAIDTGAAPLLGNGTAVVLSQTAAGCTIRANITSLAGLVATFDVIAVA